MRFFPITTGCRSPSFPSPNFMTAEFVSDVPMNNFRRTCSDHSRSKYFTQKLAWIEKQSGNRFRDGLVLRRRMHWLNSHVRIVCLVREFAVHRRLVANCKNPFFCGGKNKGSRNPTPPGARVCVCVYAGCMSSAHHGTRTYTCTKEKTDVHEPATRRFPLFRRHAWQDLFNERNVAICIANFASR